jgi:hypothetical protein
MSVGLADDQADLQRLCRCSVNEWLTIGPVVFGRLFVKDADGLWQEQNLCNNSGVEEHG